MGKPQIVVLSVAEKEGFEPSRPLWGLHDFQSCALGQTTRLLQKILKNGGPSGTRTRDRPVMSRML